MENVTARAKGLAGGASALAQALGNISSQAVSQWEKIPASRVLDVERITGISRHELRPDIFGAAPHDKASA
ncbi:MAG: Cro/CI family transcriptional regulator [Aestuariivirga sp.]